MTRRSTNLLAPPGMRWCPRCRSFQLEMAFQGGYCHECSRHVHHDWYVKHDYYRSTLPKMLQEAIDAYGVCSCGESRPEELVVYPSTGNGLANSLHHVAKRGYPEGYKMMCKACAKKQRRLDRHSARASS